LTGDLGYNALEPLRDVLGRRFVNAGVAEQNMVSVSAGLARAGYRPWVYSIAPFVFARPFEQIRNDVCLHRLPVTLVGNGGGYGYGAMGATHHALEDYGALLCLPNLRAYLPAFDRDVRDLVDRLLRVDHPAYLRLGVAEGPTGVAPPPFAPWRRLMNGSSWVVVVAGPLGGGIWTALRTLESTNRPTLWLVSELPIGVLPEAFLTDVIRTEKLLVVEEHVSQGGVGQALATAVLRRGISLRRFETRCAEGYPSGRHGSQTFHRRECGLDPESIIRFLKGEAQRDER
jgi:transketolase